MFARPNLEIRKGDPAHLRWTDKDINLPLRSTRKRSASLRSSALSSAALVSSAAALVRCCLHQVIRGKEWYQEEGHFRLIWLVEVKLCNAMSIRVRVACTAHQHPTLARLSVSLASSMQLTMTIRSRLTPTTFTYPCSHSLTNEHSRRVSRSEG